MPKLKHQEQRRLDNRQDLLFFFVLKICLCVYISIQRGSWLLYSQRWIRFDCPVCAGGHPKFQIRPLIRRPTGLDSTAVRIQRAWAVTNLLLYYRNRILWVNLLVEWECHLSESFGTCLMDLDYTKEAGLFMLHSLWIALKIASEEYNSKTSLINKVWFSLGSDYSWLSLTNISIMHALTAGKLHLKLKAPNLCMAEKEVQDASPIPFLICDSIRPFSGRTTDEMCWYEAFPMYVLIEQVSSRSPSLDHWCSQRHYCHQ